MPVETFVLHHGGKCADGFASAFAAHAALGDAAEYVPVTHGNAPPDLPAGSTVYLLDFSYPRRVVERLRRRHARVLVIDHHVTAADDLAGLPDVLIDPAHAASVLAWEHFQPGAPLPELLRYVEDRDLWRFALPASQEVNAALDAEPQTFARWGALRVAELATDGAAILRHQAAQVERVAASARFVLVGPHFVPAANTPVYQSEVGHLLLDRFPQAAFAATWFIDGKGARRWSLRSRSGEDVDVAAIAARLGGGGHPHAAGYVDTLPKVDAP